MKSPLILANVLLIDDHATFRSELRILLAAKMPNIALIEVNTVYEALNLKECAMDVVLLNIKIHSTKEIDGIDAFKTQWPQAHILMLSIQDDSEAKLLALSIGLDGVLSKIEPTNNIVNAIYKILRSKIIGQNTAKPVLQKRLTPRQSEVLSLLQQGLSNKRIASQLTLSDNTVRRHVQDILGYFKVSNRSEAVFAARTQQLLA